MKKILLLISFLTCFCLAMQAQTGTFRIIGFGVWDDINDSTYIADVEFETDLTGFGYLPNSIVDTFRMFTGTEQVYRVDSVWDKTFTTASLRVVEYGGTQGTPVSQVMVYDPAGLSTIPQVPLGSTGSTSQLASAVVTYNARQVTGSGTVDSTILATVYRVDTAAAAIRGEIAALAQPPFDSTDIATGGIGNTDLAAGIVGTTKLTDDGVTLAKMASGTANRLIVYDGSGNPSEGTVSGILSLSAGNLAATEVDGSTSNELETASQGLSKVSMDFRLGSTYMLNQPGEFSAGRKLNWGSFVTSIGKDADSTQYVFDGVNGFFGIGAAVPDARLTLQNSATANTPLLSWKNSSGTTLHRGYFGADFAVWGTSGSIVPPSGNIGFGTDVLRSASLTGTNNVALGLNCLYSNTSGARNVAIGYTTLVNNQSGADNVGIGASTLTSNVSGSSNVGVGYQALTTNTGSSNTAIGRQAMTGNTTGSENTGIGQGALAANAAALRNTGVGHSALSVNTGNNNTALGHSSLIANTTGTDNSAFGRLSARRNTTGAGNVAMGQTSLGNNITGSSNVAIGSSAGENIVTETGNLAIGLNSFASADSTVSFTISGVNTSTETFTASGATGITPGTIVKLRISSTGTAPDIGGAVVATTASGTTDFVCNCNIQTAGSGTITGTIQKKIYNSTAIGTSASPDRSNQVAFPSTTQQAWIGNYRWNTDQTVGSGQNGYVMKYNHSSGEVELAVSASDSSACVRTITQTSHGLAVGDAVYWTGTEYNDITGNFVSVDAPSGIVMSVTSANIFTLVTCGSVLTDFGLADGIYYATNAGLSATPAEPQMPVLKAEGSRSSIYPFPVFENNALFTITTTTGANSIDEGETFVLKGDSVLLNSTNIGGAAVTNLATAIDRLQNGSVYIVADGTADTITIANEIYTVTVNTNASAETVRLPAPASTYDNVVVVIKQIGSASNAITVSAVGGASIFYETDATSTSSTVSAGGTSKSYQCVNLGGTRYWIVI